ncbi:hypothetical protein QJ043_01255 [Olsenella sp. YH-ols2217]|uniref:DUF3047 domain-containing protein n=1 Tax=Kribbibacterium absianum TaxID=3044210 RepID=A0ABT6ZI42_9ACTN|nr:MULTISPECIES: hypothetical protein [unclassified Olsenella]MDJ1121225.1 hypothetical protein [Olsenella sp. YH-ols2216]MDJ1128715.1 hypothetical protein [Olsenella sp. YH-ols2217]
MNENRRLRPSRVILATVLAVLFAVVLFDTRSIATTEPNGFAEHVEAPSGAGYGPGAIPVQRGAGEFSWQVGGAWKVSSVRLSRDPIWTSPRGVTYTFSPWTHLSAERALEVAKQLGTGVETWTAQGCRWFYSRSALGEAFPSWLLVAAPEEGEGPGLAVMVQGPPGMDTALPSETWAVFDSVTFKS